jgi:hypothetical protein
VFVLIFISFGGNFLCLTSNQKETNLQKKEGTHENIKARGFDLLNHILWQQAFW